ncbi:MAG: helix-turn-helix domain-containing protein [Actinomycetota bacterium]
MSTAQNVGTRLREARQAKGLSLRSLAQELGVSASLISQVETGKTRPSVATLYSLASLLGVSLDELLGLEAEAASAEKSVQSPLRGPDVQRAAENPAIEMEGGVRWERLAMGPGGPAESLLVTYAPGASSSIEGKLMRHAGVEFAYILEGVITLQLEFDTYELEAGDSLQFDSTRPHMFSNRGTVPARGLWFVVGRRDGTYTSSSNGAVARPLSGPPSNTVEVLQRIDSLELRDGDSQ